MQIAGFDLPHILRAGYSIQEVRPCYNGQLQSLVLQLKEINFVGNLKEADFSVKQVWTPLCGRRDSTA
mgnify:CR=1 FL=1